MQDDGVSVWIACLRDLKRLLSSSSSSSSSSIRGPDNSTSNQVLVERILTNTDLVGPDALPVSVAAHARLVNDLKVGHRHSGKDVLSLLLSSTGLLACMFAVIVKVSSATD